jgi:alpha-ribazole phosphatase
MRVIFVCNATTEWEESGRIQGHSNIPLSLTGILGAQKLRNQLAREEITYILSSDLACASETASIINEVLNVPQEYTQLLRECSYGSIEGCTTQEAVYTRGVYKSEWEDQYEKYDFTRYGGESRNNVLNRYIEALNIATQKNIHNKLLVVGHKRGLSTFFSGIGHSGVLHDGCISIFEYPKQN